MKTIKELEAEIKELENRSWFRCDVKDTKKNWIKLNSELKALKDVLGLIDECDEEACCHGINKEELKAKIEG